MRNKSFLFTILFFAGLLLHISAFELLTTGDHEIKAISLKVLQSDLKQKQKNTALAKEYTQLTGINHIMGYIIDDTNSDVILYGGVDTKAPVLYLEDFVIALRNVWLKYAERKGNAIYYSNPGCSIDPNPTVIKQLNDTYQKIFSDSTIENIKKDIDQWHKVGKQPQKVLVLGIPFNSRFGKIMVDADYHMKRLVDGSVQPDIAGFSSLIDLNLGEIKEDLVNGEPITLSDSMNRFWFFPGVNEYYESDNIVLINKCPVVLLTEQEFLTEKNQIQGSGQADSLATVFVNNVTEHYQEIAAQFPVYAELEGLFRWVSLAKIFKEKGIEKIINLDYLLNDYPVFEVKVPPELPGVTNVKFFEQKNETDDGYQILQLSIPTCGGVGIELIVNAKSFTRDKTGELAVFRNQLLKSRVNTGLLAWNAAKQQTAEIQEVNETLPFDIPVQIDKHPADYYTIKTPDAAQSTEAANMANMVKIVDEKVSMLPETEKLSILLTGFTAQGAKSFIDSMRIEANNRAANLKVKGLFNRIKWFFQSRNEFDYARAEITEQSSGRITSGPDAGKEFTRILVTVPRIGTKDSGRIDVDLLSSEKINESIITQIVTSIKNFFRNIKPDVNFSEAGAQLKTELNKQPGVNVKVNTCDSCILSMHNARATDAKQS